VTKKRILILGGGTGGTTTANRLRRRFDASEADILSVGAFYDRAVGGQIVFT